MSELEQLIKLNYDLRRLVWPQDADTALQFVQTEIGEVTELLLARKASWVRNNPQSKEAFSKERLEEELGDIIMMVLVAGIVEHVDPIAGLTKKLIEKIMKYREGANESWAFNQLNRLSTFCKLPGSPGYDDVIDWFIDLAENAED